MLPVNYVLPENWGYNLDGAYPMDETVSQLRYQINNMTTDDPPCVRRALIWDMNDGSVCDIHFQTKHKLEILLV